VNDGFRSFMSGLVDYAGLFPPASLAMAPAVNSYAVYRAVAESWMLGRFICPAARLGELAGCLPEDFAQGGAWELSVLVGDGRDPAAALASVPTQARAVAAIEGLFPGKVKAAALETPIPAVATEELGPFLTDLTRGFLDHGLGDRELFLEVPATGQAENDSVVLEGIARLRDAGDYSPGKVGAKFRCGGVSVEAFPSVDRLAGVIHNCGRLGLVLKLTAGLHHPVRHRAVEPQVMMHGFLNVFGAGLLAHGLNADPEVLAKCLAETDPGAFAFNAEGFHWRDVTVSSSVVKDIRQRLLPGFGSCSFDEPRADLKELGFLI
jgi:hypothetical protein